MEPGCNEAQPFTISSPSTDQRLSYLYTYYHRLICSQHSFFPFDCCKFSALDTWNSPARPPLKAQGSWSPLRNCAED